MYTMLNGKNKVKGLYKDNVLVATWDKHMDALDLERNIANHVGDNELTEVDSDVMDVQSFPALLKAPEPFFTEAVLEEVLVEMAAADPEVFVAAPVVLEPLAEIAPGFVHPGRGQTVFEMLEAIRRMA